MSEFFEDSDKITYPDADGIVADYLEERAADRVRVTSRDVLEWSEVPDTSHNQRRIHDALTRLCEPTEANWAGRTVFRVTSDTRKP